MTDPTRATPPLTPIGWPSIPAWCTRCEIHQATNHKPLCPVCLDQIAKEGQR